MATRVRSTSLRRQSWQRITAAPSLDLRFAETKSLIDAVSGQNLITFSRASSGTYFDAAGVLQTAATNLLLRSEEFQTTWVSTRSSVSSDSATAPNGAATADKLVEDSTANNTHSINQGSVSFTSGLAYTFSCYVKEAGRQNVRLTFPSAAFTSAINAQFNLTNGTITATSAGVTSSVQAVGDGWYRCIVTATATTTATSGPTIFIGETASATTITYTGDGTSGIYIWGGQLEQSSTVGEYIPTTSTINSAPRFDHNPTTGESLGLMGEEQRTNLLLRSEEFELNPTPWSKDASLTVTANAIQAPSGAVTADLLDGTGGSNFIAQSVALTAGVTYTISVWIKSANLSKDTFRLFGDNSQLSSLRTASSSWERFSHTFTATTTGNRTCGVTRDVSNNPIGIYIWGAQLEAGASPTSYIPTTTAAATRSADVASITGSNFSQWYRQDEGTVFVDARTNATHGGVNSFPRMAVFSDNTVDNSIELYYRVLSPYTDAGHVIKVSNLDQSTYDTNDERNGQRHALGWAVNNFVQIANGQILATDTSGSVPAVTQLEIGQRFGSIRLNGHIRRITYWPARLSNANLRALTQ